MTHLALPSVRLAEPSAGRTRATIGAEELGEGETTAAEEAYLDEAAASERRGIAGAGAIVIHLNSFGCDVVFTNITLDSVNTWMGVEVLGIWGQVWERSQFVRNG